MSTSRVRYQDQGIYILSIEILKALGYSAPERSKGVIKGLWVSIGCTVRLAIYSTNKDSLTDP